MAEFVDFSAFEKLDVRVGTIESVEEAEGCKVPAYRLIIDFGSAVGKRKSIAQAKNYSPEALVQKQVLAVVNLKPRQIGRYLSEVLVLGVPTESAGTSLVVPDMPARVGGRLF